MSEEGKRDSVDYQESVGKFVDRHVIYCVSGLVWQIGRESDEDWFHLFSQDDWETPAYDAILQMPRPQLEEFLQRHGMDIDAGATDEALARKYLQCLKDKDAVRDYCEENRLEAQQIEIYEHWIVTGWLAGKLEERGEVVERDFYGLTLWGRACTGQAILLDSVICAIYDDLHKEG